MRIRILSALGTENSMSVQCNFSHAQSWLCSAHCRKKALYYSKNTPTNQILKDLHWLPIEQRIQFKLICLTFKGLYNQAPDYISEMLVPYSQTRRLRSCSKQLLAVQRTNLKYGNRAFSIAAPKLWNGLPDDIRTIKSFPLFKKRLKTYLFTNAF